MNTADAYFAEFARVVRDITAPFACGGTLVPAAPVTLCFPNGEELAVARSPSLHEADPVVSQLVARCAPAPFGQGKQTRYSTTVRDALQLKAAGRAFSVGHFDPAASGVLEEVRRQLTPDDPNPLTAELYNLNIYRANGHFKPHKDTPRGDDMIGSLVVCLPSIFSGGRFIASHRGIKQVFDWSEDIRHQSEPSRVHWAAFFGDVDHEVERVWSGARVTLTYILRRGAGAGAHRAPAPQGERTEVLVQRLSDALADPGFLPEGATIAFPCAHMYNREPWQQEALAALDPESVLRLKGRDNIIAQAALAADLDVSLQPYLVESCAEDTWQLGRFPTAADRRALGAQVDPELLAEVLPVKEAAEGGEAFDVLWVEPPPGFGAAQPETGPRTHEEDPDDPAIQEFHLCEYSNTGYFGNEGSETEFYVYAALHVEIPPLGVPPRPPRARRRGKPLA